MYLVCSRLSKPGPGPNVKFLPEVDSVRSAVDELNKLGINKIIAVGHAGIDVDKKIAKEVDGVDIVVGGHTNTCLYTGNGTVQATCGVLTKFLSFWVTCGHRRHKLLTNYNP